MNAKQAKYEMDRLLEVQKELNKFNDKQLTPVVRKELCTYIKKLTNEMGMIREDRDNVICLWTSQVYKNHGMSSDIEIYGASGTVYICDDSLWRTIEGLNEVVVENGLQGPPYRV